MDEAAGSGVDRDMRNTFAADTEEQQITGLDVIQPHGNGGTILFGSRAWHIDADLVMDVLDQSAAIEGFRTAAAEPVWRANQRDGANDDLAAS